ncbi:MAG: hypothetical protein R3F61_32135 [Myxococcota bacterium]
MFLGCADTGAIAPAVSVPIEAVGSGPVRIPMRTETVRDGFDPRRSALRVHDRWVPVPASWFRLDFGDAAQLTAADFGPTTTAEVGDGRVLVHLFAYSLLGASGSMGGAGGLDVWALVDGDQATRVFENEPDTPTMWRLRSPFGGDAPWAESVLYRLGDADGDGRIDIATRVESAHYVGSEFELRQSPPEWSLARDGFAGPPVPASDLPGSMATLDVLRPVIAGSATDFVVSHTATPAFHGDGFWNPLPRLAPPIVYEPEGLRRR